MLERISGWSLRTRLVLIGAFMLVASLAFGGLAMYWAASIEENQMLDSRLEHLGATVLSFVEEELLQQVADPSLRQGLHLKTRPTAALLYRYQVWSSDGQLLLRSHEAPADKPLMPLNDFGFETVQLRGEEYRVFSVPGRGHKVIVQVGENIDERWAQVGLVTAYYVGFLLIPFALVFAAAWVMLRRSLHSIDVMARHLRHRNPLDVTPLKVEHPPQELLPILKAFDALLARMGHALSAERRFTSVAAHEMRTPLAGLRAQAQIAVSARSDEELRDGLAAVMRGVDRAAHLIDQLLDMARIEGMSEDLRRRVESVDVRRVFDEVLDDLRPRLAKKRVDISAAFTEPHMLCHGFALYMLMRNLIVNAVLYTPEGGRVRLHTARQGRTVVLVVDDSGPGIAAAEREHAFERFNRLAEHQVEGVGLGLSIVLSVVELHEGRVRLLDSPLGGLRVQVRFPRSLPEQPTDIDDSNGRSSDAFEVDSLSTTDA